MRSKAPLTLVEQSVMLLVFALAAALCLRVFLGAGEIARESADRDRAVVVAQNTAEQLKITRGDLASVLPDGTVFYDGEWAVTETGADSTYAVTALPVERDIPGLGEATVVVYRTDGGEPIVTLPVAWQEGLP